MVFIRPNSGTVQSSMHSRVMKSREVVIRRASSASAQTGLPTLGVGWYDSAADLQNHANHLFRNWRLARFHSI